MAPNDTKGARSVLPRTDTVKVHDCHYTVNTSDRIVEYIELTQDRNCHLQEPHRYPPGYEVTIVVDCETEHNVLVTFANPAAVRVLHYRAGALDPQHPLQLDSSVRSATLRVRAAPDEWLIKDITRRTPAVNCAHPGFIEIEGNLVRAAAVLLVSKITRNPDCNPQALDYEPGSLVHRTRLKIPGYEFNVSFGTGSIRLFDLFRPGLTEQDEDALARLTDRRETVLATLLAAGPENTHEKR